MINFVNIANEGNELSPSSTWILNFTCPHSGKDVNGGDGQPVRGRPTQLMKARVDALGITPNAVICNGDWGSLQAETVGDKAIEVIAINDDIQNGGYNGKMVSISGNHIAGHGNMDHYVNSVHNVLDLISFPYTINSDVTADYAWERFYFFIGNTIHICMMDRNDVIFPYGKDGTTGSGGHPNGCVTLDTIKWMTETLVKFRDYNSFLYIHEGIAETTVATGYGDGTVMGHNTFPIEAGSGNIYTILDLVPVTPIAYNQTSGNNWFFKALDQWPRFYDFVSQGHSHAEIDFTIAGRGHFHDRNDTLFYNCGVAGRNHGNTVHTNYPNCSLIELQEGAKQVIFHRISIDGQAGIDAGVYPPYRRHRLLKWKFKGSYTPPVPTSPESIGLTDLVNGSDTDLSWTRTGDAVLILHNPSTAPTAPTSNECKYPTTFTINGDRVVYLGTLADFKDIGITGGQYAIYQLNSSGGQILWST
jgi:hypothetical protein